MGEGSFRSFEASGNASLAAEYPEYALCDCLTGARSASMPRS